MRAWWAAAMVGPGLVGAATGVGCEDRMVPPYLSREEFAEQAARDCAEMTCDGPQVAIAQVIDEVAALPQAERVVAEEVERACLAAAAAAGVAVEPPTGETIGERADQACAAAAEAVAGMPGEGVDESSSGSTSGCGATLDEVVACEQACACAGCPPRAAEATCSGTVVGRCDETCTGTCWPADEGATAACEGECFGRCEGSCSGPDDGGTCRGVCTGRCSGPCAMRTGADMHCDGACDACTGALEQPRCITDELDGGWSPHEDGACSACSTRCVALVTAAGVCLPAVLRPAGAPPDELLGALDDVWRACLRLTLRAELRAVLAGEAAELLEVASPGSLCATEQYFRIDELDPLPSPEGCWAVVFAAEP